MSLPMNLQYAKGVGEKRAKLFARLGLHTFGDILRHFPRNYEDRTRVVSIADLEAGVPSCFLAAVAEPVQYNHIRKGLDICKTKVVDENGDVLELVFFNAPYVKDTLRMNTQYMFYGRPSAGPSRMTVQNPVFEEASRAGQSTGRILPVYGLTAGLTQGFFRNVTSQALERCEKEIPDLLPAGMAEEKKLCSAVFAYQNIHFPSSLASMHRARRRLVFEELLVLQLGLQTLRLHSAGKPGPRVMSGDLSVFYESLPFQATGAQKRTLQDIAGDLQRGIVMQRLVQGDVGSGKTLIAAGAAYLVARQGLQAAMMAPTALLAEQHAQSLQPLMESLGVSMGLLTGAQPAKRRRQTMAELESGEISFIVGTHALFSEGVRFRQLALCITDEQHRFGVAQRQLLARKGEGVHTLVMSATPIPRTLAHILYGDLDLSVLDEMPPGRQKVETFVVDEGYRTRVEGFICRQVGEGRQVFIVCPLIEDENETGLQAAEEYAERLRKKVFPDLRVGVIHGKQKAGEQERVMGAFARGETDILVSTVIVEVGVNVVNASLMIVENAERFGLSQLHQLRGRVGRGASKSYCILFLQSKAELARKRLETLRKTNDGFRIAEQDLALRGPGDFFGARQHGLPHLKMADFLTDAALLPLASQAAEDILTEGLSHYPALQAAVDKLFIQGLGQL